MKSNTNSNEVNTEKGWQLMAESQLPASTQLDVETGSWLSNNLDQLNLQRVLIDKILDSVQMAVARKHKSARMVNQPVQINLRLFVSRQDEKELHLGENWGFFFIEKGGSAAGPEHFRIYDFEFYLYRED